MLVQKVESTYAPFDEIHRRLDETKMRGRGFLEILRKITELYGIPGFYAGVVARSYPGYENVDADTAYVRGFLRAYAERKRKKFKPQPGLDAPFDIDDPKPLFQR